MSESTLTFRINVEGANEAAQSFQDVGQAAKQMSSDVNSAGSEMGTVGGNFRKAGDGAKQASTDVKGFGTAIANIGTNVASAAAGIIGFVRSIENVSRAQDKATAASTKLESAHVRVEKAQNALNVAIAKFGPNSEQAAQAAAKVTLELRKEADAAARAENTIENVGFAMANASTGAIQFAASMANIAQVVQTVQSNIGPLKTGLNSLVQAFSGVEGGVSGAISALGSFKAGAAAAALAAGALVLVLNEVGKATGDLNNQKTVFGTDVVIQFEDAKRAVDGFNKTMRDLVSNIPGIGPAIASVNKTLEEMINKFFGVDKAGQSAGDGAKQAGDGADDAATATDAAAQSADEYARSLDAMGRSANQAARELNSMKKDFLSDQKKLQEIGFTPQGGPGPTHGITKGGQVLPLKQLMTMDVQYKSGPGAIAQLERDFKAQTGETKIPVQADVNKWEDAQAGLERDINILEQSNPKIDILADGTAVDTVTREVTGKVEQLPDGTTIFIEGDATDAVAATGEATTAVETVPDQNTTTLWGDDSKFTPVKEAPAVVDKVPTFWETTLIGQADDLIGEAMAGTQAIGKVDEEHLTAFDGSKSLLENAASGAEIDVNAVDEQHTTIFDALAAAFKPVVQGVTGAIGTVKESVTTIFTGQDVSAKSTAQGITPAIKVLDTTITSRFAGVDQGATQVAGTVYAKVGVLNSRFTSTLTAADQGASQTAGTVLNTVKPINNRFTAMLEARDNGATQTSGTVLNNVKPINNRFTAMLEARDQASPTVARVKKEIDALKDKTVTISVKVFKTGAAVGGPFAGQKFFRHGGTSIISQPTNIRVGEGFHPELVSVTPLGKTGGGGTGTIRHPHAATGGNWITFPGAGDIGKEVAGIGNAVTGELATSVEKQTEKEEMIKKQEADRLAQTAYQDKLKGWTDATNKLRASLDETRNDITDTQKALDGAKASPFKNSKIIQDLTTQLANLNKKLGDQNAALAKTMSLRPVPPSTLPAPIVNVGVTAAKRGFGPATVTEPTLFLAGEAGPELVNVIPLKNGTTGGGGGAATKAVAVELEGKDTFKQDTEELGKALDTLPEEWNTELKADTTSFDNDVSSVGQTLDREVPEEKTTKLEVQDTGATRAISGLKRELDAIPKNITIKITTSGGGGGGFRHGGTSIISHPTNIRVGEGFHPELVSVVPLGKVPHAAEGGEFVVNPQGQGNKGGKGKLMDWMEKPPKETAESQEGRSDEVGAAYTPLGALWEQYNELLAEQHHYISPAAAGSAMTNHITLARIAKQAVVVIDQIVASFGEVTQTLDEAATEASQDKEKMGAEKQRVNAAEQSANQLEGGLGAEGEAYEGEKGKQADEVAEWKEIQAWWVDYNQMMQENLDAVAAYRKSAGIEAAKGFGPAIVRKPTAFLTGEAGPEMVEVTPLAKGTRGGGSGSGGGSLARVEVLLEKLVRKGTGGMEANLVVDGQRMASVSEKYVGVKSYGDR